MRFSPGELFNTYSIVARDPETNELGVAVQTHQMCVGDVVPWMLPGVGAIATQSLVNVSFGPMGLAMLREGLAAPRVVEALVASDADADRRQLAVVDAQGRVGAWTGKGCIPEAGHHTGEGYSVQANMMTHTTVVPAMAETFETTSGDLAARMLAALEAAQTEDGDIRGQQSAAIKIVAGDPSQPNWSARYDLRVDEHATPVAELARLIRLRRAQLIDGEGHEAFERHSRDEALEKWAEARTMAPELEELAFWQAVALADIPANVITAAQILKPVMADDPRRTEWLDLIRRLEGCGLIERAGAAGELIEALG